jgi:hypothetical protein
MELKRKRMICDFKGGYKLELRGTIRISGSEKA